MAAKAVRLAVQGFDHVDLRFRDLPEARAFFVDRLGFDVVGEGPDHVFLLFGDQVLGLRPQPRKSSGERVDHVALRVGDLAQARTTLQAAGVPVTGVREREGSRSLYLDGPEGVSIELVERPDPHRHPMHPPAGRRKVRGG